MTLIKVILLDSDDKSVSLKIDCTTRVYFNHEYLDNAVANRPQQYRTATVV